MVVILSLKLEMEKVSSSSRQHDMFVFVVLMHTLQTHILILFLLPSGTATSNGGNIILKAFRDMSSPFPYTGGSVNIDPLSSFSVSAEDINIYAINKLGIGGNAVDITTDNGDIDINAPRGKLGIGALDGVDIETVNGGITIGAGTDDESDDPMAGVLIRAANGIDLAAGTLGMLIAGDVVIAGDAVDIEANDGNVHIVAAGEEPAGDGNVRIEAGTDVTIDAKQGGKLFKF